MPSKKKKYNARFPAGRIKKIMQTDEEVGKVAQAVPVIISRTLELFVESLLTKTLQITNSRNAKTLTPSHMKQCILSENRFDFLRDLVKTIPDIGVSEENCGADSPPSTSELNTSPHSTANTADAFVSAPTSSSSSQSSPSPHPNSSTSTVSINDSYASTSSNALKRSYPMDASEKMAVDKNDDVLNYSMNRLTRSDSQPVNTLNFYKEISETIEEPVEIAPRPLPKLARLNSAPSYISLAPTTSGKMSASQNTATKQATPATTSASPLPLVQQNSDGSFNINISSIPKMKTSLSNNKSNDLVYDYSLPSTSKAVATSFNNSNHKSNRRKNSKNNINSTSNSSSGNSSTNNRTSTCTITSNDINKINFTDPIMKIDYSNLMPSNKDSLDTAQLTPTIKIDFSHLNNFAATTPQIKLASYSNNTVASASSIASASKVIAPTLSSSIAKATITTSCSTINKLDEDYDDI